MKRPFQMLLILAALFAHAPAHAEVADSTEAGLRVKYEGVFHGAPDAVYKALFQQIGSWWDSEHTYSGDAKNLSVDLTPGGCFCEKLPDGGGIAHLTVVYVQPGKMVRMQGGLGPLQDAGVAGCMSWQLTPVEGGTKVQMTYTAGGFLPGGLGRVAKIVDQVLAGQFERAHRFVDTGKPK